MNDEIIKYITNPPTTGERFVICGKDYGEKTSFSEDELQKKVDKLKDKDKQELLSEVIEFTELNKVSIFGNNFNKTDIGTLSRYQLLQHLLT